MEALGLIRRQRTSRKRKVSRRPRWVVILAVSGVAVALALVALGVRAVLMSDAIAVRALAVTGTERLAEERVRGVLAAELRQPILLLDLPALQRTVEAVPGVRHAVIARRLPDVIEIHVEERHAVARAEVGGAVALVDAEGAVFPIGRPQPGDAALPLLTGLSTTLGAERLATVELPALRAVAALAQHFHDAVPEGTTIDLSGRDRFVLRSGDGGPALWLDRREPERNLDQYFSWKDRVVDIAGGRPVDLRFPHRLTLVPSTDGGTATR